MRSETSTRTSPNARLQNAGFSMIELMVAMSVFLVIGGVAMSLFRQNTWLYTDQQNTVGLNVSLRNSLTQIQNDTVNAGNGYFQATSTGWPFGITATNVNPGYDTLNIVTANSAPAQLTAGTCVNTSNTPTLTLVTPATMTATAFAAQFKAADQVLLLNGAGNQFTTVKLTQPGTVVGTNVSLAYSMTNADGTNLPANDQLGLTTAPFDPTVDEDKLGVQYCQNTGDWVVDLNKITYTVDGANRLTRQFGTNPVDYIADQIIGFKVGVSQFTSTAGGTSGRYFYDNTYKPRAIRSVRVSMIGRTPPGWAGSNFVNTFDGGNYKIEALSLVINPRNLSMNDCGTCN
jgi:prepilin-type N-terminal cleavage/methylation domain-containing protein